MLILALDVSMMEAGCDRWDDLVSGLGNPGRQAHPGRSCVVEYALAVALVPVLGLASASAFASAFVREPALAPGLEPCVLGYPLLVLRTCGKCRHLDGEVDMGDRR